MNATLRKLEGDEITFPSGPATLVGRVFRPIGNPRAVVLIHGATAVPQGFYRAFAEWLTTQGLAAFTYDYRDFAQSATGPARKSKATILDWTLGDQAAALAEVERQFTGTPVWILGHSLGGLFLPWHQNAARAERVITIASGLVHVSHHPWPYKAGALAFWYGPGAALTALLGFTPGKLLGLGASFPKGVYWQWRSFCTRKDYFRQAEFPRAEPPISAPTKIIAIADDDMVPPVSVWKLMQLYPMAIKSQLTLRPAKGQKIGHMGAFRRANAHLWPTIIA